MSYLFSSESVSEGHPDKVADQISDAILDQFLAYDPHARVACESFVTTGQVVLMGDMAQSEEQVTALEQAGIPAVVFGKAIYEGRINLKELLNA